VKTNSRVARKHRTAQQKVRHIARRLYRLGYENMHAQTVPCGFPCSCDSHSAAERIGRQMAAIDRQRAILTKRLVALVAR
jgi:hypothetical protein